MFFSKSFGYSLRSVLYLAASNSERRIQLDEIADRLNVPRHFLAKVMKRLAREGVIVSQRGATGGFLATNTTLQTSLFKIATITGESAYFQKCALGLKKCNASHPCPLHNHILTVRNKWVYLLSSTTINDLLQREEPDFTQSIVAI